MKIDIPQLPPESFADDVIKAIGTPDHPHHRLTPPEIGSMMRVKARQMIDDGEIKSIEDVISRFQTRAQWIADMTYISEDVRAYWIEFEKAFFASARKYLNELKEIESTFKK